MKKMRKSFFLMICVLLFAVTAYGQGNHPAVRQFTIVSPYKDVNWATFGQFKAALHVHTSRSDGADTLASVIEEHYTKGYDILAITDHNVLNTDWTSGDNALSKRRYRQISSGRGRKGRGMLRIPNTNEQSRSDHVNTFLAGFNNTSGRTLQQNIQDAHNLGGISRINHPGRSTGNNANHDTWIDTYVELYMDFPSLVGMEIINQRDRYPNDRILWDNILMQTAPQGRYVWGFSDDDTHSNSATGFSWNMFVMAKNTVDNFRTAMLNGSFYAVARTAKQELGQNFSFDGPAPYIRNIQVDEQNASITITADHTSVIVWISNGIDIATGATIMLDVHKDNLGSYIRANIIGPGGIAFLQPFGIIPATP